MQLLFGTFPRDVRSTFTSVAPPYEKLHAWRECHELALAVYRGTQSFPSAERFGLTSQIRRAAFSSAVNIVEGSARKGPKEFKRFLDIALSSLTEVGYVLRFAKEVGLLDERVWQDLTERHNRARFLTWRLYRSMSAASLHRPRPSSTALDRP